MEYTNTVLVVDDSEMILKVLSLMVKKAGFNIISAINGKTALELFDGRDIDLVITDQNMPGISGTELIHELRSREYYRYIPVVLFIVDGEEDRRKYMKASGATMLFDKNNIKEKMIPTIKKMLGINGVI